MNVRWALIDEHGDRAAWERVARRLPYAPLTVVVERWEQVFAHLEACDAIVYDGNLRADADLWSRLADTGKHWLLSHTPAAAPSEIAQALTTFQRAGCRLIAGSAARHRPAHRAVYDALRSGQLGAPGLVRIHRWLPTGNGSLVELLQADVDLTCWLVGSRPTVVYARGCNVPSSTFCWDYVQLHLGFVGEAMALLDVSRQLPGGDDYYALSVIGSAGAAYADDHRDRQLLFAGGHPQALRTEQGDRERLAQLEYFLALIADPSAYAAEVLAARRTLDVLAAVAESLAVDRAVHLTAEGDAAENVR